MKMYDLYSRVPVALQELLLSAYGARLRWQRYGRGHAKMLTALQQTEYADASQIHALQRASLSSLLSHAAATVPYYRRLGMSSRTSTDQDLRNWPILEKQTVRAEQNALLSDGFDPEKLISVNTSGTTGTPITIKCTREALQKNYAFFERSKRWAGVGSGARVATFAGRPIVPEKAAAPYWRRNYSSNTLLMSSYHVGYATAPAYLGALTEFAPDLIDSYPSAVDALARYILDTGASAPSPRAIITSSETLDDAARARLEQAFTCDVYDQYGAAEMATYVTQCKSHVYHVNPEFGILELLDDDGRQVSEGETGQMVATGFLNSAMPLIRYATGDYAERGPDAMCECGRSFPRISRIGGRMDDVVITPDGNRIGRLDPIFKGLDGVSESQIVQDAADHLTIELVPLRQLDATQLESLQRELRLRVGARMRLDIRLVESIPRTKSGKRRLVVNMIHGGDVGRGLPIQTPGSDWDGIS